MNERKITLVEKPTQEKKETELDLQDLLAYLLVKWKKIIAFLVIGALLGCGGALINNHQKKEPITEEVLYEAREVLATDKAVLVDQLFFQYVSYKEFQEDMRDYYSNFAASDVSLDNTVQMRSEYYIVSTIKDLDTVFIKMAVTEADYQAMRDVAPDKEAGATIYDRISFTTAYNEKPDELKNNTINNTINISIQEGQEIAYLINVELYGNSEEQCRDMMSIVEAAFRRETEKLKILDSEIKIETLGEQFDYNVADYVQTLRKKNIDRMTTSEGELNDLNNKVGKLSSEEKNYYNLLMEQYDEAFAVEEHVSLKKWTVIGAFLGVVIACCAVFFPYLLDGRVKSSSELEQDGRLLNRVFIKGRRNLFGRWAADLIHADETDPTVKADMVATDINILMEKNGKNAVMLLCNQEDSDAVGFAEQVKARLQEKNGGLKVCIGNPTRSVDELEMAAQADMGVAFAEMKKSKRSALREWRQICERYKLPLAGSVAVQRCW
ncbi:MAG: hypothetical protein K6C08_15605 [Oscillospiraceae bacterium]|nr:hypothetical protein [Oscillospiraceae bacterium]